MKTLAKAAVIKALVKLEFNWQQEGSTLVVQVETKDFNQAVWVINEVAKAAEELNHHPDINLANYNQLTLKLSTHESGGVTDKDLALAERIDAVLTRL